MNSKYSYLNSDCSIKVNEIGCVERNDTVSNSDYSFSYSNWNGDLIRFEIEVYMSISSNVRFSSAS